MDAIKLISELYFRECKGTDQLLLHNSSSLDGTCDFWTRTNKPNPYTPGVTYTYDAFGCNRSEVRDFAIRALVEDGKWFVFVLLCGILTYWNSNETLCWHLYYIPRIWTQTITVLYIGAFLLTKPYTTHFFMK